MLDQAENQTQFIQFNIKSVNFKYYTLQFYHVMNINKKLILHIQTDISKKYKKFIFKKTSYIISIMNQSQTQRSGCINLGNINLTKYTYKQIKTLQQIEHKPIGSILQSKQSIKLYQLTFYHNFTNDTLVTNFEVQLNEQKLWGMVFDFGSLEASCITNRGYSIPMTGFKQQRRNQNIFVEAHAFTQSLKFVLTIKKDFSTLCEEIISFKKQKSKQGLEQNINKLLNFTISSIKIYGYNMHSSPPASQLIKILNISQNFKKSSLFEEQAQTNILLALCLINARRFIQASQILRKASNYYVKKYNNSKSHIDSSKYERSWIKDYQESSFQESLNMSRNYSTGRVLEGAKYLFKAAKIELLLAQTITHPSLRSQKVEAYNRSNSYFNGDPNPVPFKPNADIEQIFLKIGPNLIVFLIKVLYDKAQILRIAALKSIEFIYETIGCSLSQMIPQLLKTIILTYPLNQSSQSLNISSQTIHHKPVQQKSQNIDISSSKSKILIDSYHHLLQTFISLLPLMNKKCLRSIFKDIIVLNISNNNSSIKYELKLYMLRFSQKIISLCLSDLEITAPFLSAIVSLSQRKFASTSGGMKYTIHNLSFFAQRIIELLKAKILTKYNNREHLISICSWINENLVYFCENELTQQNLQFFSLLIDFLSAIYSRIPNEKLPSPIQPMIYFLNMSINQTFLPFQNILNVTINLLKYIKIRNQSQQISQQIVERIVNKAKFATLNIKQLKILESVLKIFHACDIQWLQQFLNCIPHSTFDQIYSVFSILFQKSLNDIDKPILQKVIDTFIDQYTVKGKAHQFSKITMINLIKKNRSSLVKNIFQICLTQNTQPGQQDQSAQKKKKKSANKYTIDTKMFKIRYESFVQKLQLFLLFLSNNQVKSKSIYDLLTIDLMKSIYFSLKKLLESKSSKIKLKSLKIIKSLIQIVSENIIKINEVDLFFVKSMISLLKSFIVQQIQSKLHYQALLNIGMIFNQILKSKQGISSLIQQSQLQFMDGAVQNTQFNIPSQNISQKVPMIRFRQFVKMYPAIINLLNSPWQNIRQIVMQTIIQFFSKGLLVFSQAHQKKVIQILKPLLTNYLRSADYSQRFSACKLIGCLISLSKDYSSRQQMVETIGKSTKLTRIFLTELIDLQQDWHQNTKKTCQIIIQVSLSPEARDSFKRKIQNWKVTQQLMQNSYHTFNLSDQYYTFSNKLQGARFDKNTSTVSVNNEQNFQNLLKQNSMFDEQNKNQSQLQYSIEINDKLAQQIGYFKSQILKSQSLKTSFFGDKESFFIDNEQQHYFEPNDEKTQSLNGQNKENKSDQQPLQFQDLGIIDLDDEQWGEEQSQVKITQKLPLKKIYKLSPNIGASSKHMRSRSKRYFSHQFDSNDKIIVDELEGKINNDHETYIEKPKPIESQNLKRFQVEKFKKNQQFQQFEEGFEQNQSFDLKVESKQEVEGNNTCQKIEQKPSRNEKQRPNSSNKKSTKKTTIKKRKSSILK